MDPMAYTYIAAILDGKYISKIQILCLKKSSCRKMRGKGVIFPISNFTNGQQHCAVVPGSQTIVNIRGVQKLHLPSDSCCKFLTHQVICHGEMNRNMNNLLQTLISSLNWAQWLSMVVYHKSKDAMVTKVL